ncbi:MAG TPA: AAA family ATPase [Atopostipes sp.]|nr:AAA family ATPase [Atopostipes sp.]
MLQLRSVQFNIPTQYKNTYPYNLPVLQQVKEIEFTKSVTILVGDNGTGKSTLLNMLAASGDMITIGDNKTNSIWSDDLIRTIKLTWNLKTKTGFYFKANDFIQFIEQTKETKREARQAIQEIQTNNMDSLATMPHARTLHDLEQFYGEGLEFRSHGESFLDLFRARFRPNGLYLLDEPEAPLSPLNQLALISLMKENVQTGAQFILATHSPMLMAFPNAEILLLEKDHLTKVSYEELEHVNLTRDFLNNSQSFLRHL